MTINVKKTTTRRAAKVFRRRQLIEAAITSIAKRGLGDTTLAHVSKEAGLSQGIVNLHFTSKENLLNETIKYIRSEYEDNWRKSLEKSADDPASQLANLLRSDYQKKVSDVKKLAVWFAFWGEAKSRPTYKKISQERVADYSEVLRQILERLIKEGDYQGIDIPILVDGIVAMADGLWLNILISAKGFKRDDAEKAMMQYLCQVFPKHKDAFV
ncbi:MAG: TetR family transcriptional regulator C-terminal domain-containing protein [Emcibacteraceae bacterium]|nr:TetR family transcriptional regulator C-terminal domain-containing protein [Emcibacteraceae bacterium]MDG1997058.1 TetR family transcriptional regulator C-terminal domain-containing protein [Emcibacteraceae bacterium]